MRLNRFWPADESDEVIAERMYILTTMPEKRPRYLRQRAVDYKKSAFKEKIGAILLVGSAIEASLNDYDKTALAIGVVAASLAFASYIASDLGSKYSQAADYYETWPDRQKDDGTKHFIDRLLDYERNQTINDFDSLT